MSDVSAVIARLRGIEAKATKGPWFHTDVGRNVRDAGGTLVAVEVQRGQGTVISASRNALAALLDVAEAAAAVEQEHHQLHLRERLREALARLAAVEVTP